MLLYMDAGDPERVRKRCAVALGYLVLWISARPFDRYYDTVFTKVRDVIADAYIENVSAAHGSHHITSASGIAMDTISLEGDIAEGDGVPMASRRHYIGRLETLAG